MGSSIVEHGIFSKKGCWFEIFKDKPNWLSALASFLNKLQQHTIGENFGSWWNVK
jgi:hypothetical protein